MSAGRNRPMTAMSRPQSSIGRQQPSSTAAPAGRPSTAAQSRMSRQVADKSYFMGLLRSKITELHAEMHGMTKDIEHHDRERQNYAVYEQKAELLASELKDLQGELADLNTMQDKLNTNTDIGLMSEEWGLLKLKNDEEAVAVDTLFADRRQKEEVARHLEMEVEMEKREAEAMIKSMTDETREVYEELKQDNEQLSEELRLKQEEMQDLEDKKSQLEDEMAVSKIKQEAMMLHEQLAEAEAKKSAIEDEIHQEGTPEEQREGLIAKVKQGNEEVFTMDKHANEVRERMEQCHDELRELDDEYQDQQGEKNQKYRELRQKEQQIDEFLSTFQESETEEKTRIEELQKTIVRLLGKSSKYSGGASATTPRVDVPKPKLETVDDLKEEHVRLQDEIGRLEEVELRNQDELESLREKCLQMRAEVDKFSDLDALKSEIQHKEMNLQEEENLIEGRLGEVKQNYLQMQQQVDTLKRQLENNDTHIQIVNLEKKLQYAEQNNFVLRESIDSKNAETNVGPVKQQVMSLIAEYNTMLINNTMNKKTLLA